MSNPRTKNGTPIRPALSPFDVEMTPEAKKHLDNTINQIVVDFLAAGRRTVAVPVGQANAVKAAFEGARPTAHEPDGNGLSTTLSSNPPQIKGRRWKVEIIRVNGLIAELQFRTEGDPEPTPEPALELLAKARRAVLDLLATLTVPNPERTQIDKTEASQR